MPVEIPEDELPDAPAFAHVQGGTVAAAPAWLAGELAAAVPLGTFGFGGIARVELGARLARWEGRVAPVVSVGYAIAPAQGSVHDPITGLDWTWTLLDQQMIVGSGFTVRVKPASEARSAELLVLPELAVDRQVEQTSGGSSARSGGLTGGGTLAVSLSSRTSTGSEWVARGGARIVLYDGVLTGAHPSVALVLSVGYRHAL